MNVAERSRSFDGRAAQYDSRWDYAPEAIDAILAIARLGPQSAMADLGAGTGMVSRHFASRVGRVYAVEPNAQMRAIAEKRLGGLATTVVVDGFAHATGLPDGSVDLIAAGRALHWFDLEPTKAEMHRILRPGGWLAVLQTPATDAFLQSAMLRLRDRSGGWGIAHHRHTLPATRPSDYFGGTDFVTMTFPCRLRETWPAFIARLGSYSWTPRADQPEYGEFERLARAVFDEGGDGDAMEVEYATEVLIKQIGAPVAGRRHAGTYAAAGAPLPDHLSPVAGARRLLEIDPEGSLAARFEHVAERLPYNVAIRTDDRAWTYSRLNGLANRIAHHVLGASTDPARPVALCFADAATGIAAMLGVLKAGRAYCPLSASHPLQHRRDVLAELRPQVLLYDGGASEGAFDSAAAQPADNWRSLRIDPDRMDGSAENLGVPVDPGALAGVYFTSGSTGRPKGIMRSHRFFLHRIRLTTGDLEATAESQVSLLFELAFGAAATDIYLALLNGATLHPYSFRRQGLEPLAGWLQQRGITIFHLPIALFRQFVAGLAATDRFPTVRFVTPSGKQLWSDVEAYRRHFSPDCRLVTQLSSTETSVLTLMLVDHHTPATGDSVPVGYPVADKEIWLVDEHGERITDGRSGEIVVRSRYLFSGEWGDPAVPVATPAAPGPRDAADAEVRTHHTGDLGRWLPDGSLAFIGRRDARVKIRGYTVDLAEVEVALSGTGLASQSAVYTEEDRDRELRIVAYVAPSSTVVDAHAIRGALAARLPDYMLPAHIVLLDALPLTLNGKVDRAALPAVGNERPQLDTLWTAPRTGIEVGLCAIWAEVLGIDAIGVDDRFLDLGGNSLQAARIVARVLRDFDVDVPFRALFDAPTVAEMAAAIASYGAAKNDRPAVLAPIAAPAPTTTPDPTSAIDPVTPQPYRGDAAPRPPLVPLADRSAAPLSFAQQRMWFLHQLEPDRAIYNMPGVYRLRGDLDVAALERAIAEIVRRHAVLRTVYAVEDGRPKPIVLPPGLLQLPVDDLRALPESAREAEVLRLASEERLAPFDLATDRMLRARLWRTGDDTHVVSFTKHHIASDGWSLGVFWSELGALYAAALAGDKTRLPELPIQYADFAAWQRAWLTGDVLERQLAYWKGQLADLPALDLPADHPRPALQRYRGASHRFTVPGDLVAQIDALARRCGATRYMTLLAAWQVLLHRHSGQDDIAVGTPFANRDQIEIEDLIGFFANTLVMRGDLSGNPTFREVVGRVRRTAIGAFEHQSMPFEQLVAMLNPERLPDRHPLFQVLFQVLGAPATAPGLAGLEVERVQATGGAARFDLELTLRPGPDGLNGALTYCADLFDGPTVERFAAHFVTLLRGIVADPDGAITRLPLMSEAERRQVLVDWNDTATDYPHDRCVHQCFEDQVRRSPDAVALVFGDRRVTYDALNRLANRAASGLGEAGVRAGDIVGICVPRSPEMVVALLALLKSGSAYLPLDPDSPPRRLADLVADAGVRVVVTHTAWRDRLPAEGLARICIDTSPGPDTPAASENPPCGATADDLAYVMFTSGTSGRPKGVEVRHRSVNRLVFGMTILGPDWHRSVLQLAPLAFDASTFEIWGPLLHGGCLVLAPDGLPDLAEIETLARRHDVRTAWLTAGLFNSIVDARPSTLAGVRNLLTGGEALSVPHVRLAQGHWPNTRLFNGYGPTEGTTFTCCHAIDNPFPIESRTVPIGRPIGNTRVYVLDAHRQPVPIGVAGELCICGDGVARGYLNQPDATAARFVPDPFTPGERMYRSGDRARWRGDGTLEFLGRSDDQVKIRGYRIEPAEIAAVLGSHDGVADCAVVAHGDGRGGTRLAAYFVARERDDAVLPAADDLEAFLRARLPAYMVPSAFVALDRLPLGANGKLDRRALPVPGSDAAAPRLPSRIDDTETAAEAGDSATVALQRIWSALLGREHVDVHADFFDLGGHSLLAVQLFARIEAHFGRRLPLVLLFERPTIAGLAAVLGGDGDAGRAGANGHGEVEGDRERAAPLESSGGAGSAHRAVSTRRAEPTGRTESISRTGWEVLVPIQPHGRRPAFFCVHGFGGGVVGYADLARLLGPDQPFFGLQARGLNGEEDPDDSIDRMAARYIEAMRSVQPVGPYRVGGYCFGGVVALEMARQLEAAGDDAALVAIIEGYAPARRQPLGLHLDLARARFIWRSIPFWTEDYVSLGLSGIRRRAARKLRPFGRRLRPASADTADPSLHDLVDDDLTTLPENHLEVIRRHVSALHSFRPQPYGGGIALFTARGKTISKALFGSLDPYHGWRDLARGGVTVHPVDGAHRNLHLPPHVASLAAALGRCLEEVAGEG